MATLSLITLSELGHRKAVPARVVSIQIIFPMSWQITGHLTIQNLALTRARIGMLMMLLIYRSQIEWDQIPRMIRDEITVETVGRTI